VREGRVLLAAAYRDPEVADDHPLTEGLATLADTSRRSLVCAAIEQRTSLPSDISSAARARRFVREVLSEWELDVCEEVASLAVSELITNAVLHARSAPELVVRLIEERLRVEVHDASPALPARKHYAVDAGTGRGLLLVERLVGAWGVEPTDDGKVVWFEIDPSEAEGASMGFDAEAVDDLESLGLEPPRHTGSASTEREHGPTNAIRALTFARS